MFAGLDFFVSVMLTQLSILFLYKRTLTLYKIWFRNTLFVLGFFCVTNGVIITIGRLCRCRPLSYSWTRFETDESASFNANKGYCTPNMGYMWPAHAIVTLLIDTGLVVAPLPLIWGLQMSRATKQALAATFLLGIL